MAFWQLKQRNLGNNDDAPRAGFDNPLSDPHYDLLERKAVTNHVYAYLTEIDPKWSVRVGLIAPWGEGKTTIGEWIAARALKEGHIPVWWRDPWTANTDAELWLGFYTALTTALKNQGIEFESSVKHAIASISGSNIAKKASELHNYAQAGLGFVQDLTRITSEDIDKIKTALGEKRVIVIIDELDRVDAALIPRLLMSLRGVMDLEGFSFLIPFDERVVSEALSEHIQAEGYGERFLEKILDFRVYLTSASEQQVITFFHSELKHHCPFISIDMLEGLDTYLPSNPRKLKSLVRGLKLYQSEGERHRPEEIDWKAVVFMQMIRMESELFFQIFKEDTFGKNENLNPENISASNPWMHVDIEKDDIKAKAREKERLEGLLAKAGIEVTEIKDRLIKVCEGWRICQGYWNLPKVFYALRLLDMPETLTWAEFDDFWKIWSQNKVLSHLTPWISKHAMKMERSEAEIARELIKTLVHIYDFHLDKATRVYLHSQHTECIKDAETIFELMDKLVDNSFPNIPQSELLTIDTFQVLFDTCCKWTCSSKWTEISGSDYAATLSGVVILSAPVLLPH